ncbi:Vps62-related protein [Streptomyces iconiensis]|uniref:Vps62-related protein n=1 Tax=Streptomyces iconiensis TaxID=1384038 RepID=A0ABT6ZYS9_9ACTN|nr:Vps62-related protein [Streptomyces iconiensis]MDJ1134230.1 Vps62-related protein [Streptomyces iconiensis]
MGVVLGDLEVAFTTGFTARWNDRNSGGRLNTGFWQPVPPAGFRALGTLGRPDYGDPNGVGVAVCVRQAEGRPQALADPVDYEWRYDDKGSGARLNGSTWRPVPPSGYVALGDVCADSHYKPALTDAVCVREDLTAPGPAGGLIWNVADTGGRHRASMWRITAPPSYVDATEGPTKAMIAPGGFVTVAQYEQPAFEEQMRVLRLPLPSERPGTLPAPPQLTGRSRPASATAPVTDHAVRVPMTAVVDTGRSVAWKVANSPFYTIERQVAWKLLMFANNATSVDQWLEDAVTVGVEKSTSESFQVTTGVSVTVESGVQLAGAGSQVSATVSTELGYATSTSVSHFEQRTVTRKMITPAGHAAAMWVGAYSLRTVRGDGSVVGQALAFDGDSFHTDQYPD